MDIQAKLDEHRAEIAKLQTEAAHLQARFKQVELEAARRDGAVIALTEMLPIPEVSGG